MFTYIVFAAVLICSIAAYPIIPCLGVPPPLRIDVQGCPNTPCNVTRGSSITFQSDFEAIDDSPTLTLQIQRTALGHTDIVPLPSELSNACDWLVDSNCPISAFDFITHGTTIPLFSDFQGGIPVNLVVSMVLADGVATACAQIELRMF